MASKEELAALRLKMLEDAGLTDSNRIPEIEPLKERKCRHCYTTGPCTPAHMPCSGCGEDLFGSPRVNSSLFDETQY